MGDDPGSEHAAVEPWAPTSAGAWRGLPGTAGPWHLRLAETSGPWTSADVWTTDKRPTSRSTSTHRSPTTRDRCGRGDSNPQGREPTGT